MGHYGSESESARWLILASITKDPKHINVRLNQFTQLECYTFKAWCGASLSLPWLREKYVAIFELSPRVRQPKDTWNKILCRRSYSNSRQLITTLPIEIASWNGIKSWLCILKGETRRIKKIKNSDVNNEMKDIHIIYYIVSRYYSSFDLQWNHSLNKKYCGFKSAGLVLRVHLWNNNHQSMMWNIHKS